MAPEDSAAEQQHCVLGIGMWQGRGVGTVCKSGRADAFLVLSGQETGLKGGNISP